LISVLFDRPVGVSKAWVRRVVEKTLKFEKSEKRDIGVLVTGNRMIRRLNNQFLKHDYPTDVISFGFEEQWNLGDLVVSAEMAKHVSKKLHIPFREELARYLVHGTLHLLGYDDKKKKDQLRMHQKQEAIVCSCGYNA
jgi:probable rRNA maturation factor